MKTTKKQDYSLKKISLHNIMYPMVYATQTQFSVLLTISHSKVNVTFIMQKHCRTERGFVEIMQLAYYFIETVLNQRKDISNWLSINQTATSTFPFKKLRLKQIPAA